MSPILKTMGTSLGTRESVPQRVPTGAVPRFRAQHGSIAHVAPTDPRTTTSNQRTPDAEVMIFVGCDVHCRAQQIAVLDTHCEVLEGIVMASIHGQHRRRFTGRVRAFTEQRRQEFAQAGAPILPEDQQMVLTDYLDISRRRHLTLMPLFKLQLHMLQDIATDERGIKQYKGKIAEMAASESAEDEDEGVDSERSTAKEMKPPPGQTPEQQAALRSMRRELYFLKAEVRALRDIGDGIAWRLFDFDRAVLHELARRPTRQHVNPQGIEAEMHTLAEYVNDGHVALLNVLTHFLKFGDVTVRRAPDDFEIVEVKAGTSGSGRLARRGERPAMPAFARDSNARSSPAPTAIACLDSAPRKHRLATTPSHMAGDEPMSLIDVSQAAV
jgi:hypothetical protein